MNNKLDCEDCRNFFFSKDKLDYDCVFQNTDCEVVGNVYENKELLDA